MSQRSLESSLSTSRDLVVVAGSSGGMEALHAICLALPADFPAAIAIVQHRMKAHAGLLAELLTGWTTLDVCDATEGAVIRAGTIYIAPPDKHMTVTLARTVTLIDGVRIKHVLSSADPLFESAALAYGDRLTAVVLTGHDGDGTAGTVAVRVHGGTTIAQDPATAACASMPRSAIATGAVDHVLSLDAIAPMLVARATESMTSGRERPVGSP
jgi:two-component system, chemotaxis family, protein-glutamate methylesterase/glutaminase